MYKVNESVIFLDEGEVQSSGLPERISPEVFPKLVSQTVKDRIKVEDRVSSADYGELLHAEQAMVLPMLARLERREILLRKAGMAICDAIASHHQQGIIDSFERMLAEDATSNNK